MAETTITEEISLSDVWHLLIATATKVNQLYTALEANQEPLAVQSKVSTALHVTEHPYFGMTKSTPESVAETMTHLRENRYAL